MLMWRYLFHLTILLTSALGSSGALLKDSNQGNIEYVSLESRTYDGIGIVKGTCPGRNLTIARQALTEAFSLAQAGMAATTNYTQPPFTTFFDPHWQTSQVVASVYQRMLQALSGTGGKIGVLCNDSFGRCTTSKVLVPLGGTPAYSMQPTVPDRPPLINLCPVALELEPTPDPCTIVPGEIYLGWVVLASMATISSISGPGLHMEDIPNNITAASVMSALAAGQDTITSPIAYAHLGLWARELGIGSSFGAHQRPCPERLPPGGGYQYDTSDVVGNRPT